MPYLLCEPETISTARGWTAWQPGYPGAWVAQVLRLNTCCDEGFLLVEHMHYAEAWIRLVGLPPRGLNMLVVFKSSCQAECCSPFFSGQGGVQWFPSCPQFLVTVSLLPCSRRVLLPPVADSASGVAALCARPGRCFDLGAICLGFFKERCAPSEISL